MRPRHTIIGIAAVFCCLLSTAVWAQNQVVVIPMLDTRVLFSGIGKTGDIRCSKYLANPGNWQQVDCAQVPTQLQGQDAQLREGVAMTPRYTDHGDGTVSDNLTNLIWLKNAFCSGVSGGSSWSDALAYVVQLNQSGMMNSNDCGDQSLGGGHQTDWRLPNIRELQSLLDYGAYQSPYISAGHPFVNLQEDRAYWSSTNYGSMWDADLNVYLLDDALRVNFSDAVTDGTSKDGLQHVWAVRSEN